MATRFYLTRTLHTTINPGTLGTWGSSVKAIYNMELPNPGASSFLSSLYTGYGQGTVLFRQFISPEMSPGIVFDGTTTYNLVMRHSESSTSANAFQQWALSIVDDTGATSYFSALTVKDSTEFGTSLAARSNTQTGGITYTTVTGDRLVLEVGWDQDGSGSYTITNSLGNTSTDLSGEGDTGVQNPWFETSNTITFGGGDPPPPATSEDYELTAYISGVLDEWV